MNEYDNGVTLGLTQGYDDGFNACKEIVLNLLDMKIAKIENKEAKQSLISLRNTIINL